MTTPNASGERPVLGSPEAIAECNRRMRQQRIDLLTALVGPPMIVGLAIVWWKILQTEGWSASVLLPMAIFLTVGAFVGLRWHRWSSTRGHSPGRHRR